MNVIEVDNIYRAFGKIRAVNGLSFRVGAGQVVGFIGANGAGKTTTMRMMVTLDVPDAGTIEICNMNVIDHPRDIRRLIGWMPDHFGAYPNMDVWEYLDFYGRAFGLHGRERQRRLDEVMAFTDMDVLAERPCNALSKGQTQRLCLSRALLSDPQVLVLDEPAAGLDPKARIEFKNLVKLLADRGKTLFISSHILSELGEMCDHLLFIDNGRQVHQGTSDSLRFHKEDGHLRVRLRARGESSRLEQWIAARPEIKLRPGDNRSHELLVPHRPDDQPEAQLAGLLRELLAAGVEVYEFNRVERRLEDAFVEILGGVPS
ncbi:ABC transporter ATP-binding protein [Ruficoccus amylovorans]|uniref:ABC transporter ATP-binding protein n=1 Tax=Ruficoccus amylovorans TaxID=1804625 RepID=A0A842HGN7_9BACT|nr:ABC transporter ATP-binding protein [Ruficoccus amylovorans]MBC2594411.1 ABC transporter ATP-binding protein [Ruficoccus amylovorans]